MPLPGVLALLSARQRALIPFFERALDEGLSATRAIATVFRGPGRPGISNVRGFALARQIQPNLQYRRLLANVGESFTPDPSRIPQALGRTLDNYIFRFRVETSTGDDLTYSLGRTDVDSRENLESIMRDVLTSDPSRYQLDIASVRLIDAVQAGPAGTIPV